MPSDLPLEQVLMVASRLLEADELDDPSVGYRSIEGLLAYEVYKPQGMALYWESLLGETQRRSDDDEVEIRIGDWKFDRKYSAKGNLRYEKAFYRLRSPADGNPAFLVEKIIEEEDPLFNDRIKENPFVFYLLQFELARLERGPRLRGVVKE